MKITENKPHSVHLRLTEEQYDFLFKDANILGVGVSDYIRMLINTSMYAAQKITEGYANKLGDLDYANNKSHI